MRARLGFYFNIKEGASLSRCVLHSDGTIVVVIGVVPAIHGLAFHRCEPQVTERFNHLAYTISEALGSGVLNVPLQHLEQKNFSFYIMHRIQLRNTHLHIASQQTGI